MFGVPPLGEATAASLGLPLTPMRAGLVRPKERNHASEAMRDNKTRDWVQEVINV